jgi:hypothetical protein
MYPPPPVHLPAKARRGKLLIYNNLLPLLCFSREEPVPTAGREGGGMST